MEKLDARIRNHDREIEKMCNFHYQGFVDSITEFLKVRAEAQKLKVREGRGAGQRRGKWHGAPWRPEEPELGAWGKARGGEGVQPCVGCSSQDSRGGRGPFLRAPLCFSTGGAEKMAEQPLKGLRNSGS